MKSLLKNKIVWVIASIIIIAALVILFIPQHNKNEQIKINAEYAEFVSAVTSGTISIESSIKVVLVSPFKGDSIEQESVLDDLFSFSPGIKGHARWVNSNTVEFIPTGILKSGSYYEVSFQLHRVATVPGDLSVLKFSFQTIEQNLTIEQWNLLTYNNNPKYYYQKGSIITADVSDNLEIEKVLGAAIGSKAMNIKWQHSPTKKEHIFVIDSIERNESTQQLIINWDGNIIRVKKKGSEKVEIPAIDDFKVLDAVLQSDPDQYFTIYFSDPLNPSQNLEGLVSLEKVDIKLKQFGNTLKVYPGRLIAGESHRLRISENIENYDGKKLGKVFYKTFGFSDIKPAIQLVGKGIIMPLADSIIMPFKAVNLKAVDVTVFKIYQNNVGQFMQENTFSSEYSLYQVGRPIIRQRIDLQNSNVSDLTRWHLFSVDLGKLIKSDPGAIYKVSISFKKSYSLFHCEGEQLDNENEVALSENISYLENEESEEHYNNDYSEYDKSYSN
jgi:hypothetical protein